MGRYDFGRWNFWIILLIIIGFLTMIIAITDAQEAPDTKLKDYEIGVENWRGYTLGSRIESKPDAQFVTVVHRFLLTLLKFESTISLHLALSRLQISLVSFSESTHLPPYTFAA